MKQTKKNGRSRHELYWKSQWKGWRNSHLKSEKGFYIPKQWADWCKAAKLRPLTSWNRGYLRWTYLVGRGHHWRINCLAQFQLGDNYDGFDRWANSVIASTSIPKTKAEFLTIVKRLLKENEDKKRIL